ncbi:Crp/Fnr family transcriptional regulator [Neobacillus jeddahensis]|uniref:Crp/Fnr family transcriptional regulator n=1 Tax=Neobacillus jeddahensis TaxID=1461580 RepID=UPI000A881C00|nr:Crp/Fnr family transcriptional regulator [Neobacillus jeddahensis]
MLNSHVIKMDVQADLQQFDVFTRLTSKSLQKFLPHFYYRCYKKNQCLFMQGDPRDKIFFLLDGFVMYERASQDGDMLYLDFIKKNQMFPYGGIFQDKAYQDTAIAVTDVHLYFIQTHILEEFFRTNPKQLIYIIHKLSDILNLHQKRVQRILIPNAQERVLHSIQFLMEDLGVKDDGQIIIPCPLTASHISKLSGTTRETVSLFMNQLKRENVISVSAKKIRILQPDYFKEI